MAIQQQTAELTVILNGEAAKEELTELSKKAKDLSLAIDEARRSGNETFAKQLEKDLRLANKAITDLRKEALDVNKVLNNLSGASVKDLRATLTSLQAKLNNGTVKRGSQEWDILQQHVRNVKTELYNVAKESEIATGKLQILKNASIGTFAGNMLTKAFDFLKDSIGTAYNKIKEFEQANADLAAILGVSRKEIKDLTAEARRLGETTQYTASQVTLMQTELAKLGFENTEIKKATADVLNFATAMDADLPAAAELAGASMRAFGLEAADMNRVVSTLASGANRSALSFEYFQTAMSTVAPVAKSFGFTIEDTTALLGTLSNSGFDASSAATATRNILLNLADSGGKLAKALGQPIRSLDDLVPAFAKLKEKGVDLNATLELTDKRSVAAFNTFLDNAESIGTLRNAVTGMGDDLQKMVDERMNIVEGSTKMLQSAWEGLMLSFSGSTGVIKKVIDALASLVGGITKIVTGKHEYQKQIEFTAKALLYLITVGAAYLAGVKLQTLWNGKLKVALMASNVEMAKTSKLAAAAHIAKLAWSGATALLTGNLTRATAAMKLLNMVIKANPIGLLISVVAGVVIGLVKWVEWINIGNDKMKEFRVTTKQITEESKKYTGEIDREKIALNNLVKAITNTNKDSSLRQQLINKLKNEYPEFLKYIDDEKISNEKLLATLRLVNQEYDNKSKLGIIKGKTDAYNSAVSKARERQAEITGEMLDPKADAKKLQKKYDQLEKVIQNHLQTIAGLEIEAEKERAKIVYENSMEGINSQLDAKGKELKQAEYELEFLRQGKLNESEKIVTDQKEKVQKLSEEFDVLSEKLYNKLNEPVTTTDNNTTSPGSGDKAAVQRKAMNSALLKIEENHLKTLSEIKQKYIEGDIKTEYEYNQKLLEQQNQYDEERKNKLNELLKTTLHDKDLRIEATKQIADIESKNYDRIIAQSNKLKKILLDADPVAAEKQAYENRLRETGLFGVAKETMTKEQLTALELLEKQFQENMRKIDAKGVREYLKSLDTDQAQEEAKLAAKHEKGLLTEGAYQEALLKLRNEYLHKKLATPGLSAEQKENTEKEIAQNEADTDDFKAKERKSAREKYDLPGIEETYQEQLKILADFEARGVLTHDEALKAKALLDQQYLEAFIGKVGEANDKIQNITGNLSSAISGFQEAETMSIERKYNEQIKAAGNNEKKVKKLEEEKQKELAKVKAKYADKQFIVTVAQITASTALAAMQAYAAMAGIIPIGPVLGAAAAAAAITAGAAQIAVANEQREAAKAGYDGGGFTPPGPWDKSQGTVHSEEFVGNRFAVRNPVIRKIFNVVDEAQKNNTVSSLGERDFARALNYREAENRAMVNGFSNVIASTFSQNDDNSDETLKLLAYSIQKYSDTTEKLNKRLDEPFVGEVSITGKKGIKENLDLYDKMISNASRT